MKRRAIVAGNWKMHRTVAQAVALARGLVSSLEPFDGLDRVLCPPFTALLAVGEVLRHSPLELGAQNMHWEEEGAYTGEISPPMVADLCRYVILGHSERRQLFGETDETANRKLRAAHRAGLLPILCVGEDEEERDQGWTEEVVGRQVRAAFSGVGAEWAGQTVVAYEPVWAIGTGRAATPEEANAVISQVVRPALEELYGSSVAGRIRVQYGGSVSAENIEDFMRQPEIDGALVGGASLRADSFTAIVEGAARAG